MKAFGKKYHDTYENQERQYTQLEYKKRLAVSGQRLVAGGRGHKGN
jgi:hypothetical protein